MADKITNCVCGYFHDSSKEKFGHSFSIDENTARFINIENTFHGGLVVKPISIDHPLIACPRCGTVKIEV